MDGGLFLKLQRIKLAIEFDDMTVIWLSMSVDLEWKKPSGRNITSHGAKAQGTKEQDARERYRWSIRRSFSTYSVTKDMLLLLLLLLLTLHRLP